MPDGAVQPREGQHLPAPAESAGLSEIAFSAILIDMRTGTSLRKAVLGQSAHLQQFFRHIDKYPLARDQYAQAREASLDAMAEDAVGIADDPAIPSDHKRVMVDTRKWFLSKLAPKKYGDRVDLTVTANGQLVTMTEAELLRLALKARTPLVQDEGAPE